MGQGFGPQDAFGVLWAFGQGQSGVLGHQAPTAPLGPWAVLRGTVRQYGIGPWGALEVIPRSLRMGSHYEWMSTTSSCIHYECMTITSAESSRMGHLLATGAIAITNGWISDFVHSPLARRVLVSQKPIPIQNHRQNVPKKHRGRHFFVICKEGCMIVCFTRPSRTFGVVGHPGLF